MEQSVKFKETKERVDISLSEIDKDFFQRHYLSLNRAVSTYGALLYVYKDKSRGLDFYVGFRESFYNFYGIGRFVSKQFANDFYNKLVEVRNFEEYDARKLVAELKDVENGKLQFSFITKLLNIMDDSKYPIYDSYVAKAFGLNYIQKDTDEERIEQYIYYYTLITKTYEALLTKHQDKITQFKEVFKNSTHLSDMRIIDMIVWKIGELMVKK